MEKKKRSISSIILLAVALILICFSLYKLIPLFLDYKSDADGYKKLRNENLMQTDNTGKWYDMVKPDWEKLKKENPEIVAWQYNENSENISYPVLYSGNNSEYLRKNIYHKYSLSGSLFIDANDSPDMTSPQTIIYGHNMRVGLMYGTFKRYKREPDYYKDHQYVQILTPTKAYRYRIFSYFDTLPDSYVYNYINGNGKTFYSDLVSGLMHDSINQTGINVSDKDRILTMSTCAIGGHKKRFPVSAVLVSSYDYVTKIETEEYKGSTDWVKADAAPGK